MSLDKKEKYGTDPAETSAALTSNREVKPYIRKFNLDQVQNLELAAQSARLETPNTPRELKSMQDHKSDSKANEQCRKSIIKSTKNNSKALIQSGAVYLTDSV